MSAEQHDGQHPQERPRKKRGGRQLRREEVARVLARFRKPKPWPADRVERRDPTDYQKRSEILFWRCHNAYCGHYTPEGSRAAGMCLICFTPGP